LGKSKTQQQNKNAIERNLRHCALNKKVGKLISNTAEMIFTDTILRPLTDGAALRRHDQANSAAMIGGCTCR